MLKFYVSMGVLFFLAFSLLVHAQEVKQAGTVPVEAPSDSPAAIPDIPSEITIESSVGNVLFPHNAHMKFGCIACHHQIHAMELDTPHPDYLTSSRVNCQGCHDSELKTMSNNYKCSDCHHSEPENIADETLSSKVVIHKSCWKCHRSGTGVKASEGCSACHVRKEI
jgi:hypothetical protein